MNIKFQKIEPFKQDVGLSVVQPSPSFLALKRGENDAVAKQNYMHGLRKYSTISHD